MGTSHVLFEGDDDEKSKNLIYWQLCKIKFAILSQKLESFVVAMCAYGYVYVFHAMMCRTLLSYESCSICSLCTSYACSYYIFLLSYKSWLYLCFSIMCLTRNYVSVLLQKKALMIFKFYISSFTKPNFETRQICVYHRRTLKMNIGDNR